MLSELTFGSFLIYGPRASSLRGRRVRGFVKKHLKQDLPDRDWEGRTASQEIALRLRRWLDANSEHGLLELLHRDAVLVPVPKSTPHEADWLWPSKRLAEALCGQGLGREVIPILERKRPVKRSSSGYRASARPTPEEHYESLGANPFYPVSGAEPFVLVDDVVTRGSTLIGSASRLSDLYPEATVRAFAAVRTMSKLDDVPQMIEPCVGVVRYRRGRLQREP